MDRHDGGEVCINIAVYRETPTFQESENLVEGWWVLALFVPWNRWVSTWVGGRRLGKGEVIRC